MTADYVGLDNVYLEARKVDRRSEPGFAPGWYGTFLGDTCPPGNGRGVGWSHGYGLGHLYGAGNECLCSFFPGIAYPYDYFYSSGYGYGDGNGYWKDND